MKKTLIALAVLGSIAGVAQAQSSVTVYGVVDVNLTHDNNGDTSVTKMQSAGGGVLNGSRIGFKGSEDLGGGLSAIFQIENGFGADDGTQAQVDKPASGNTPAVQAKLFNRLSFVGLSGGFGTVKLGRQNNPVYANNSTFDPFGDALAGDSANLINYSGNRTDNVVSYGYAANGFRAELQYGLGEVAGNSSAKRTIAGFVGYKNGPIDVVLTHQNTKNGGVGVPDTDGTKVTLLGGNYNFGVVKAFATYAWEKGVDVSKISQPRLDQRDALVGLSAPVGAAGTVMLSYLRKTDRAIDNADANQIAIGYTHNLSKRTALYTSYGVLRNDDAAKYKVTTAGNNDKLFNVGIRHFF